MGTTNAIKNIEDIVAIKTYFLKNKKYRNYLLVTIGLNTALRISDILSLKWKDVYDFQQQKVQLHVTVTEKKTKKINQFLLNTSCKDALELYMNFFKEKGYSISPSDYIFQSKITLDKPITRVQAFRIITSAAKKLNLGEHISCHSLRKTFGYQAWKSGAEPALIMDIFNHSSYDITKRYLGIDQDDKDKIFSKINL